MKIINKLHQCEILEDNGKKYTHLLDNGTEVGQGEEVESNEKEDLSETIKRTAKSLLESNNRSKQIKATINEPGTKTTITLKYLI